MIKVLISRSYRQEETLGMGFVVDGIKLLYRFKTLELADKGNEINISCIPEGIYRTVKYNSAKHGKVFLLKNVPGRSEIEIHAGNFKRDTHGCILPGTYFVDMDSDSIPDVAESKAAMNMLNEILPDEFVLYII